MKITVQFFYACNSLFLKNFCEMAKYLQLWIRS